jgi:UDP-glucose 4-epimerase
MFDNKVLMITGGTGSFGQTILKRFIDTGVREVRVFSRDENKQESLRLSLANSKAKFFIGDVRDYDSIRQAMAGVDYVFHAAALKQVPSCEFWPLEAVKTNILGTQNVLNAALDAGTERVIVLSSDKAVYPVNAMGMTKALAEKVVMAKSRLVKSVFCATRYGNVMASRGSVIPLFIDQVKRDVPITVTDPNMTRFLMSLEDSVDLVLHAFQHGRGGDLFIQKAPAATMGVLADAVRQVMGKPDHPIQIIGTRHGEKLYETLVSREEMARAEELGRYYRVPVDSCDLNYSSYFVEGRVTQAEDYTSHNTERLDLEAVKALVEVYA